jgi:Tol biopolymer transport system component
MKLLSLGVVVTLLIAPAAREVHAVQQAAKQMRLLFHGYVEGRGKSATAIVGADGISNITNIPFPDRGELSPDGRRIAFDTCARSHRAIAIATLDNSDSWIVGPVFGEGCVTVRWSPDSAKLSYAGGHDFLVHVIDLVTGVDLALPGTFLAPGWHSWSSRGDAIVYETGRGGTRRIDVIDLATWRTRQLVGPKQFGACEAWAPDWAPAADRIAFTSCDRTLYVVNADGRDLRRVATPAYAPRWSIDGQSLLFLTNTTLRRVPAGGGRIENLGSLPYVGGPFSLAAIR